MINQPLEVKCFEDLIYVHWSRMGVFWLQVDYIYNMDIMDWKYSYLLQYIYGIAILKFL